MHSKSACESCPDPVFKKGTIQVSVLECAYFRFSVFLSILQSSSSSGRTRSLDETGPEAGATKMEAEVMVERVVGWEETVAVAAACLQILYRALRPPIHPIPIRPWSLDAGFGGSGRRREADKRIALSSRNDIFDQHFHITPGRGASRITRRAEFSLRSLSSSILFQILLFLLSLTLSLTSLISAFASCLYLVPCSNPPEFPFSFSLP